MQQGPFFKNRLFNPLFRTKSSKKGQIPKLAREILKQMQPDDHDTYLRMYLFTLFKEVMAKRRAMYDVMNEISEF